MKKILSWLVCARRPLKVIEVEHILRVRKGEIEIDNRTRAWDILELCGPIVEKKVDRLVFVHFSARESDRPSSSTAGCF